MAKRTKNIMKSGIVEKSGLVETPARKFAVKPIRYKARGKYKIVDGVSQLMIEPSTPENRSED